MTRRALGLVLIGALAAFSACATAGSTWMAEPLPGERGGTSGPWEPPVASEAPTHGTARPARLVVARRVIGRDDNQPPDESANKGAGVTSGGGSAAKRIERRKQSGHVLGRFRNTYYDFPSASDYTGGKAVPLENPACKPIAMVSNAFFQAVCVQGSGTLKSGKTVSFAKRDCACAQTCTKTGQKICFDELDQSRYPWGRGATGLPITPLLTVAVDTHLIPLGTPIYIPEYDGVPRDPGHHSYHDGCFIAQDRGRRITGKHIDVFTGDRAITKMWNRLVPSNHGVTVVLDSPHCARVKTMPALNPPPAKHGPTRRAVIHPSGSPSSN